MKLGVYNAILHDRSLPEAIDVVASLGLTGIEVNSGGFLPPVHIPNLDEIIASKSAANDYLALFAGTGVEIAGLNCNGNPLHPNPAIGLKHAEDIRRSIKAAAALGQTRVVTMSGLPGGEPGATRPNWIVNAWNSGSLDQLDYQWGVAAKLWSEIDKLARDNGVKVALVFHAAAKDIKVNPAAAVYGVLDNRFRKLDEDEDRTNLGDDEWVNEWPKDSAWDFVALGKGHDTAFWTEFLRALHEVDPDMAVNIEHEDVSLGRIEGLEIAARVLQAADAALSATLSTGQR
ncbi:sugar phosphate isomerase/epimerase [Cryobacterium sp. Y57]|uniref:sugar phosphate isomerase/epimerase family protein n=1 Tax=Cryobacterium sp. Y57 TaxID=2048287 RepID=UPI000CE52208|nr:sugar phosphate isomerase/epimerase [Cryobacterium sp. Y57]